MSLQNPFAAWAWGDLLESLLPDFVLAFAFFTSLIYAVLGKRFGPQRPAVAASAALGFALATGLVWWEQAHGFSIRDLGPLAVGFAVLILALVMYQAIRQIGGSWAGAGITLGVCILVVMMLGINAPIDPQMVYGIMITGLVIGFLALLLHHRVGYSQTLYLPSTRAEIPAIRDDLARQYRNRCLSEQLANSFRKLRRDTELLGDQPQKASDLLVQLQRILPAEGYLTEQMARLRKKAHQIRNGHIAKLDETKHVYRNMPTSVKKQAAADLAARYQQLIDMDQRLERLDTLVAENESKIRRLTCQAKESVEKKEFRRFDDIIKTAEKLQASNSEIFVTIDQMEQKLSMLAQSIANEIKEEDKP